MKCFFLAAAALNGGLVVSAENNTAQTWYSTSFITEAFTSSREIGYGSVAVTPVPTSTASLVLSTSYLHEPLASRNINVTTWSTVTKTLPLTTTVTPSIYTTRPSLPTITLNGATTETTFLTTTIATVTLSTLVLPNGSAPTRTATVYTGTYQPLPGQEIVSRSTQTAWPTMVTVHNSITASYRIYTYTGSTSTITSFWTDTSYQATATASWTTKTIEQLPCIGGHHGGTAICTRTAYATTATQTMADAQLGYVNATRTITNANVAPTVTYAAKCAPTNLLSTRMGHGVAVQLSPYEFTFPMGFPGTLIGIPTQLVADASACCQLCADNKGCAVSEWILGWDTACRLFYHIPSITSDGKASPAVDLCGRAGGGGSGAENDVPVKYIADAYSLPGQGSFIQAGCGKLEYLGLMDPFCPTCVVDE